MFALLWGPTLAAVSVILDHAEDRVVIHQALDGLLLCARIASCHRIDEVQAVHSLPNTSAISLVHNNVLLQCSAVQIACTGSDASKYALQAN